MYISISQPLIDSSRNFLKIKKCTIWGAFRYIFHQNIIFVGWGRKKSGLWAVKMAKIFNKKYLLLEDGFIRSFGLGVEGSPSFSIVKDDIGIYYDATSPSKLEDILNSHNFKDDIELMRRAKEAKEKIIEYEISKYNNSKPIDLSYLNNNRENILIIAQTYGDSSLKYGLADRFTTKEMIDDAIKDNPDANIYIKIHPDVLSGKKKSDILMQDIPNRCIILDKNINPIKLLKYFQKVYTKTSGMGFEALLLDKEVYCYGMPFYAGWGVTKDRLFCKRRVKRVSIDEIFAGAYMLYSSYYNPYTKEKSEIIDIIRYIKKN